MAAHRTTLETEPSIPAQPTDYLGYWQAERHNTDNLTLKDREQFNQLSRVLGSLAYNGIRDPNLDALVAMPEVLREQPQDIPHVVATWDRATGSFNHMAQGQGDLLRGAGLLLQANRRRSAKGDFLYPEGEPEDVLAAFASIFEQNGLDDQAPTPAMLLMGQLIHKAGWAETDPKRQKTLFGMAEKVYTKLYKARGTDIDPETHFRAGEYLADIKFHNLAQRYRQAERGHDTNQLHQIKADMKQLQLNQLMDLELMGGYAQNAESDVVRRAWAGQMVEHLVMIQARHDMYLSQRPFSQLTIRRAFLSEDEPLERRGRPKTSFDVVIQHYDDQDRVVSTSPVQLKARQNGASPEDARSQGYVKDIQVLFINGLGTTNMLQAAEGLQQMYINKVVELKRFPALQTVESSLQKLLPAA